MNWNICGVTIGDLEALGADCFLLSPPCQPFTRQGLRRDSRDHRTDSFFHLMHALQGMKSPPSYILLENVQGFENSATRGEFAQVLKNKGYTFQEFLFSPVQFGIPNSRLRYFLLAKRTPLKFGLQIQRSSTNEQGPGYPCRDAGMVTGYVKRVLECGPAGAVDSNTSSLEAAHPVPPKPLSAYLEEIPAEELERYLVSDKVLERYAMALDIVRPGSTHSCCFTRGYSHYAVGTGSVLQHAAAATTRGDMDRAFVEYLNVRDQEREEAKVKARALSSDQRVCVAPGAAALHRLQLRYFSPREMANLLCFPPRFSFPAGTSLKQRYRLLGNSINVSLVSMLMAYLFHNPS